MAIKFLHQWPRYLTKSLLKSFENFIVDCDSLDMINELTNAKIKYAKGVKEIDMCKALDDWGQEIREEGLKAGEKIGREAGERIGVEKGERIGKKIGRDSTLASLVQDGILSLKDAAERAGVSAETFQKTWILN